MNEEESITITRKEYVSLLKDSCKLNYLEGGGVDNWEGYSDSLTEDYESEIKKIEAEFGIKE